MKYLLFFTALAFASCSDDAKNNNSNNSNNTNTNNITNSNNNNTNNNTNTVIDEPSNNEIDAVYESIEVTPEAFVLNGKPTLLRGGTIQWQRLPEGEWEDRIKKFRAAGFNTIDMYVAWNMVETQSGVFNFTQPDMGAFLNLVKKYGLFVYFRPGPYICNELNGGGVPSHLMDESTKKTKNADGFYNFRTDDPDWLNRVSAYFTALNNFIKPWLITNGGPIILYGIENEYNWFETFAGVDKLFNYEGSSERDVFQDTGTKVYLESLRDFLIADDIDVPVTTCPGDSQVNGMGDAEGIIPMPNMYKYGKTEKYAYDTLKSMHDPTRFGGAYTQYPTGTTESERKATRMMRTIMGGMDAFFAFNAAGLHQEGRNNAMVLNNAGLQSAVDTSPENILNLFVSPTIGWFHNVVDYYGPISPSGVLRTKYYHFRRRNMFLASFEEMIASAQYPERSGLFDGANSDLTVDSTAIGAFEDATAVHWWFDTPSPVIQLLNESGSTVTLDLNTINFRGRSLPVAVPLSILPEKYPGAAPSGSTEINSPDSPEELHYSHMMVFDVPLTQHISLVYSTAEILTLRDFNDETLLIVYTPSMTQAEMLFSGNYTVYHTDCGMQASEINGETVYHWTQDILRTMILTDEDGKRVRILIADRTAAGRAWFFKFKNRDMLALGPEYFELTNNSSIALGADITMKAEGGDFYILSPEEITLENFTVSMDFSTITGLTAFTSDSSEASVPPALNSEKCSNEWIPDSSGVFPTDAVDISGELPSFESMDIHEGTVWVSGSFELTSVPSNATLYVENASDIVGIYVNGHYITTVSPHGTEINSASLDPSYNFSGIAQHLKSGTNWISFRTTIWGHGSFMWPRGTMNLSTAKIPALGFDSLRGIIGAVSINSQEITNWKIVRGLQGEKAGFMDGTLPDSTSCDLPSFEKGNIKWFEASFDTPSDNTIPLALSISGTNLFAEIYLNGHLVGRYISDEGFISRGTWTRSIRDMWMNSSPDHFPLAQSRMNHAGPNRITIVFFDCSGDEEPAGYVENIEIIHSPEEKSVENGITVNTPRNLITHHSTIKTPE
ncbi:beta-galactosidase [Myxococcota bacterium]|nr:beta-galactosidase [Myxococcota bacterium]MBU1382058.1 beta-galactosidase [Myxococcota bacterium]MBU1495560.1 beta-galactosidase [Myxococcota bacterium]